MKNRFLPVSSVLFLSSVSAAVACGPEFPVSYCSPSIVAGRDTSWYAPYTVRMNVRYELGLLGKHFFPDWAGRELVYVPMSPEEAHRRDFLAAAAEAGFPQGAAEPELTRLFAFSSTAADRLRAGEEVAIPEGVPVFAQEFWLYALGRAQRLADEEVRAPAPWRELLALPSERRHWRTVWVRHGLVLAAPDVASRDRALADLRADLDAGFADTCGLEEAVVRQLVRRGNLVERLHYLPLAAAVVSPRLEGILTDDADALRNLGTLRRLGPEDRAAVAADPLAAETVVSLGWESILPDDLRGRMPILCADRRAWVALQEGDFDRGRALLALAPTNSPVRLFWEARLARIGGDDARSAELLRAWLAEVDRLGGVPPDTFEVHMDALSYWSRWWEESGEDRPRTREFDRVVEGELGAILVTQGDFEEAIVAFAKAHSWIDMAFVAERCLATDALVEFVRSAPPDLHKLSDLQWLLARRLVREGRAAEAGPFFPEGRRRADWESLTELAERAKPGEPLPKKAGGDDPRAAASFNLARLLFVRGMELCGTELEPDVHSEDGAFGCSGVPVGSVDDLPRARPPDARPSLPVRRFHYRGPAFDAARRAAWLADDPDLKVAALLLQAQILHLWHEDPDRMDPVYKALCAVPGHPLAEAAARCHWFPWDEAQPLLARLRAERHEPEKAVEPLTIPELRKLLRETPPPKG